MLYGRASEQAAIEGLLDSVRGGCSGSLVIRGPVGIGKSALLQDAVTRADGFRVLRTNGVETESTLPYAGLQLLLGGFAERFGSLPAEPARALRGALGLAPSPQPAPQLLVGLAVLSLLAELAERQPVLVVVDDAQWLDPESTAALVFAARRLEAEGVGMVLAVREPHAPVVNTAGLPELRPAPLPPADAAQLLPAGLPADDRERLLEEAAGNPLALRVLPTGSGSEVRGVFADQLARLPESTRTILLIAAADDTGASSTVLRAAERIGATAADLEPAERAELVEVSDGQVRFGHPLIRSTAYDNAPAAARMAAHEALAEVVDDESRRAWHRAASVVGPDESVAAALEKTAEAARERGGYSAVTAAYERAAALSPTASDRARRSLAAAESAADAGSFERAASLLDAVPEQQGRAAAVRARLPQPFRRGNTEVELLVAAALASEVVDDARWVEAARAAWTANDFAVLARIAECAETLPRAGALARAALATNQLDEGAFATGLEELRSLLAGPEPDALRDRLLHARIRLIVGDIRGTHQTALRLEAEIRRTNAIVLLPRVQVLLARSGLFLGRHRDARIAGTEGLRVAEDTEQPVPASELATILAELAAIEGDEASCRTLAEPALEQDVAPSSVHAVTALSLLDLGLGRPEAALSRLEQVVGGRKPMGVPMALPTMVEAAVRTGHPERAAEALRMFAGWAEHVRQPWVNAILLRCRALVSDDTATFAAAAGAEALPLDQARAELLYGARLRRDRRMREARGQLRSAAERFERLGAMPWADRARTELRATGETRAARDDAPHLLDRLTPQELQVVRLAAVGLSNREIGSQLFLSPRTVGYHLYKAYPKLGVSSRTELAGLGLSDQSDD